MGHARIHDYLSQVNAVSSETFFKYIEQQIYERSFLFRTLKDKENIVFMGGHSIHYPVRTEELGLARFVDPDTSRFDQVVDTRTPLTDDFAYLVTPISLTWEELSINSGKIGNKGGQIVDLAAEKVDEALEDTEKEFSTKLFQDYSSKSGLDPVGVHEICRTSGTLHNLSAASATAWVCGQRDTTTTTLSLYGTGSLDELVQNCYFDKKASFTHITTKKLASIYASKLLPGERREPEESRAGSAWWTDQYFQGLPIIVDLYMPDDQWFLLDFDHMKLIQHSDFKFNLSEWQDDPDRYNALRAFISWKGQLLCTRRRSQGCFTALTA